jgi:hypothetical protein
MPFNVKRTAVILQKEILRSASGLDDIKSVVVDSTKVAENPASSGRFILEAGTVMIKIPASSKVQPINAAGAAGSGGAGAIVAADIVGIAAVSKEFFLGTGITAGAASDEPFALLHHGCDFNVSKLVGYTGNETITKAALPTCVFR